MWSLHEGDCLEIMPQLPDKSIDMILCDLPYGTTACKWDVIIPFAPLWKEYERLIKDNGVIVLTASQPFTSLLVASNLKLFKYCMIWEKTKMTNFLNAPRQPMRNYEDIVVLIKGASWYNPVGVEDCEVNVDRGRKDSTGECYGNATPKYIQTKRNYPNSIIKVPSENDILHPTQKPVALFEYLIRTYTNPGDTILDNCAGSGTTGVAAENMGRNVILIEKDIKYCKIIRERLTNRQMTLLEIGL